MTPNGSGTRSRSHAEGEAAARITVDPSGVEAFLSLVESGPIAESDIQAMLRLPVYRKMIDALTYNKEVVADIYTRALTRDGPDSMLDLEDPRSGLMAKDVQFARMNRSRLRLFLKEVQQEWDPTSSVRLVRKYLPEDCTAQEARVTLLVGLAQGMQSGNELLIDLPLSLILRPEDALKNLTQLISHELHHLWRGSLTAEPHSADESYRGIVWALTQLEGEGIAMTLVWDGLDAHEAMRREAEGMIRFFGEPARELTEEWLSVYDGGHVKYLSELEEAMRSIFNGEVVGEPATHSVTSVLHSTVDHPVGHEMALRIQLELGQRALTECVSRPYRFLQTYQEAAKFLGNPSVAYVFDDALIEQIGRQVFARDDS